MGRHGVSRYRTISCLKLSLLLAIILCSAVDPLCAQSLEFDSGGLHYQALTRNGLTIMFAPLALQVRGYAVLQVAISNGAPVSWTIKPEDFRFEREGAQSTPAVAARIVVGEMLARASRGDVTKLVSTYEAALYGNTQMHSTNGYEARRQDAMAELGPSKLKAAAAASAIALVQTKLGPGQSTDGAIFYATGGKPLGAGKLIIEAAGESFEFRVDPPRQGR